MVLLIQRRENPDKMQETVMELVDLLWQQGKHQRCGELIKRELGTFLNPQISQVPLEVECFVRCGKYQQALEAAEANVLLREQSYAVIKNAVKVAYDLKRNAISQVLTDFDKRYLRLKLVQLTKRKQQASLVTGEGAQQFDADQMSMSGMSSAESHQSGRSILSATGSDFSETSKKSRKAIRN